MATNKKPRVTCFVASAFNQTDVDLIYDQVIRPVLRSLQVTVTRVDRIEHNDDIDDRIMQLMRAADFCIADLTFARPSVYYEAGHITGSDKPVIFIARSDHFRARDTDPEENLRVHFDLQMKNIIGWTTPNKSFQRRLTKRVSFVLRMLADKQQHAERQVAREATLKTHRNEFTSLSITDKTKAVVTAASPILRRQGFGQCSSSHRYGILPLQRRRKRVLDELYFRAVPRLSEGLRNAWSLMHLPSGRERESSVSRMSVTVILAPLGSFNAQTISHSFPTYTPVTPTLFKSNGTIEVAVNGSRREWEWPRRRRTIPCVRYVGVLPQVTSTEEMKQSLSNLLASIEQLRARR
jgi:nucleoside 2-deoxyribosyltransferase